MKFVVLSALAIALATPAWAQEGSGTPLLRVYVDSPYFYDILAEVTDSSDPQAHALTLTVEGKEVGQSRLIYSCETGDYSEKQVTPWTGSAERFIPAALMAYHDLRC